jgi:hypothetical protein
MLTDYLPLSSLIDFLIIFLTNGMKSLYRMAYAITKVNKDFIKRLQRDSHWIATLGEHSRKVMPTLHGQLIYYAFKYPLGSARQHKLSQQ